MRIRSIVLEHFRNYPSLSLALDERDVQLFVGENGSGKTNLLEAVAFPSLLRSCRGREDAELVAWGQSFFRVRAKLTNDAGVEQSLEAVNEFGQRRRKTFFLNDIRVSAKDMIGRLPTVTFLPQDLLLFSGAPAERRRFLDDLLMQVAPEAFDSLALHQKILRQRNALLKRIAGGEDGSQALEPWDRAMAFHGSRVTLGRLELIEMLNVTLPAELGSLGESWEDARLVYERKTVRRERQALEEEILALLREGRERDVLAQTTLSGPHREDWRMERSGKDLPSFASRGQERVAVLALLLLQVSYLELKRGERPVVLLDDAFSELDDAHQSALLERLKGCQVLMTAVRVPPRTGNVALFRVEEGRVTSGTV